MQLSVEDNIFGLGELEDGNSRVFTDDPLPREFPTCVSFIFSSLLIRCFKAFMEMVSRSNLDLRLVPSHGIKFQCDIGDFLGTSVHHPSSSLNGCFFLLAIFRHYT